MTDTVTEKLHAFTENIKIRPEVRESYMLWEEYEEMMREELKILDECCKALGLSRSEVARKGIEEVFKQVKK